MTDYVLQSPFRKNAYPSTVLHETCFFKTKLSETMTRLGSSQAVIVCDESLHQGGARLGELFTQQVGVHIIGIYLHKNEVFNGHKNQQRMGSN